MRIVAILATIAAATFALWLEPARIELSGEHVIQEIAGPPVALLRSPMILNGQTSGAVWTSTSTTGMPVTCISSGTATAMIPVSR